MGTNSPPLKQQAHALIDNLPDTATWDDVRIEIITVQHYRQRLPRNRKRLTKTRP